MSRTEEKEAAQAIVSRVQEAVTLLEELVAHPDTLGQLSKEQRRRLLMAAGRVSKPDAATKRAINRVVQRRNKEARKAREEALLEDTGIRKLRAEEVFLTPRLPPPTEILHTERETLEKAGVTPPEIDGRHCYVCKESISEIHHFYDQMCGACAKFNYAKRSPVADLSGRTALITGSRVKIGYQAAILMLRAGARVICTTRFPADAASRYAKEPDFELWKDRLEIYGLDLRHTPSVEALTEHLLGHLDRLDFIINNACQTVRRPPAFYEHLMAAEAAKADALPPGCERLLSAYTALRQSTPEGLVASGHSSTADRLVGGDGWANAPDLAKMALLPDDLMENMEELFPEGRLDSDLQQIDLREKNSWRLKLDEVSTVELIEVNLVNSVAPFVLNARLKPLMTRVETRDKHIVNVSAVEGQFYRMLKTDKHPHTNMAKAALNMMTRTSAMDYIKDGIHMNAVDTGWVTDEDPAEIAARKKKEHGFSPPLDIVDGAARIVDPIFDGFNTGNHIWGQFLKDYKPTHW